MAKKKKTDEEIAKEAKDKIKKLAEAKDKYLKEANEKYKAFEAELNMTEDDLIIAKAKKRAEQLQAKILKLEAEKEINNLRSKDTRRKILLGAFMMADTKRLDYCLKTPEFDKFLERDIDRELFGLPKLGSSELPQKTSKAQVQKVLASDTIKPPGEDDGSSSIQ